MSILPSEIGQYVLPVGGTLVLAAIIYKVLSAIDRSRRMPPGPLRPVLTWWGDASNDADRMLDWQKKWGDLVSFRLGPIHCVVANSHSVISQLLVKNGDVTSGRHQATFPHHLFNFVDGIIFTHGEDWKQRKTFIVNVFRQFGFSKYEQPIAHEREYLVEQFRKFGSTAFNPMMLMNGAVSNIIYQLLFGERMDHEELKRFERIITHVNEMMTDTDFNSSIIVELLGRAVYLIPGDPFHAKRQRRNITDLGEFFNEQIARIKAEATTGEPTCLVDAFIRAEKFTDMQIRSIMFDLLIAGMETTTTTLRWALLLMAMYPDVQRRVRAEIHEHFELKPILYNNRAKLVYTEAVMHEIERFTSIVPFSVPHTATDDFTFNGYLIPKNAMLLPNLYAAHHDERIWPHASTFNPANFYDETKKGLINLDKLISFSVGRRSCLGESLANQELFMFFAGLMQNFEFIESETQPLPGWRSSIVTVSRSPRPYVIVAKPVTH